MNSDLKDEALVDDDFGGISIVPSTSGADRVVKTQDFYSNTEEIYECNVETNTDYEAYAVETQVDAMIGDDGNAQAEVNLDYLGDWLEAIYPRLANILEMNASSRTFEHYEVKNDDGLEANSLQHTLTTTFEFTDPGVDEE